MAAGLLSDLPRATDTDGNPISGATWTFYDTGTSTPRAVYSNDTLATSLGSVVTANSAGQFVPIYLNTAYRYRAVLKDAGGSTLRDIDPVNILDAMALLGASSGAGLVQTTYGTSVQAMLDGYATRSAIKALTPHTGARAYLYEQGREGWFTWDSTVTVARHQKDTQEGLNIAPNPAANGAWVRMEGLRGPIKAKWFGASSSLSDCSAVFEAIDKWVAYTMKDTAGTADSTVDAPITIVELGVGEYTIKTAKAFHDGDRYAGNSTSITFIGMGQGITTLIYDPTVAGPMINNSQGLNLRFENMSFLGALDDSGNASTWMSAKRYTYATQGLHCRNIHWNGYWLYGVNLEGTNNNSEHVYTECTWYDCTLTAWQYSETATVFDPAADGSEQFVNYTYTSCKYWVNSGPWIDMASGGHIRIQDCDASAWGHSKHTWASATYLFNLRGENHSLGVLQFVIDGLRVEIQNAKSGILLCEWPLGNVTIRSLETSSQSWVSGATRTAEYFKFYLKNSGGPVILFSACDLMGKARFQITDLTNLYNCRVTYESCNFWNVVRFSDYFAYTWPTSPISFQYSLPSIKIRDCIARDINGTAADYRQIGDATLTPRATGNWTTTHVTTHGTVEGTMPFSAYNGSDGVMYPVGAVIRKFRIYAPAGHTGEAAVRAFTLMDQTDAVIATASTGVDSNLGFNVETVIYPPFRVTSGNDILRVETDATQDSTTGRCEVEWTG